MSEPDSQLSIKHNCVNLSLQYDVIMPFTDVAQHVYNMSAFESLWKKDCQ